MPNPLFRPPRHLVKEWPEVFEDLYMNTMPLAYLESIHLEFVDGRVWRIDIKSKDSDSNLESMANHLMDTLEEYKEDILKIDFKINIEKLKKDIKDSSKTIL
jgi:gas vesicle protein